MQQQILQRINWLSLKNRIFQGPNYDRKQLDEKNKEVAKLIEDEIERQGEEFNIFQFEKAYIRALSN